MAAAKKPARAETESGGNGNGNRVRANGTRILVVDDVDDNRDLYATYFAHAGFDVEQAVSGQDALEKIDVYKPNVVIMDLAMPDLDGWETTRRIKSSPTTRDILVIVVTGHATRLGLERAKDAGADAVCTKPCLPNDLCVLVQKHLGERRLV